MDFLSLLSTVAPVFLVMGAGFIIYRLGWLSPDADSSLLRVVVNLLTPCLIVHTVLGNASAVEAGNVVLPPLLGFVTVASGYFICYAAAPLFGITEPPQRRTFAFTAGIYNYGYIALPVVETLYGPRAAAVLFIHNVGVETALWTVGVMMLSGRSPRAGWKHIFTPPVVAIIVALALHFAGAKQWMPDFIMSALKSTGAAAIPLGLVLTGATFAEQARNLRPSGKGAVALGACVLRLGLLPISLLAVARWLPCAPELRHVIMVQAAMPSAVVPVILAKHYGGDPSTALRIVLVTSAMGLVTVPLWLKIGLLFVGP